MLEELYPKVDVPTNSLARAGLDSGDLYMYIYIIYVSCVSYKSVYVYWRMCLEDFSSEFWSEKLELAIWWLPYMTDCRKLQTRQISLTTKSTVIDSVD